MSTVSPEHVRALLEPVVGALGADLEDLSIRRAGKRSSVVILVDKDDGINMDEIAAISRGISDVLEDQELFGSQPYVLEVSSPGVGRPLTLPRHWRRNKTRLVEVVTTDGSAVSGRIVSSDGQRVELDTGTTVQWLQYEDITRAIVQIDFGRKSKIEEET